VGSADYFARHARPHHPRDLTRHNCLHYTHYLRADEWHFVDQGRELSVRVRGRMRANNQEALVDAVLSGAGLAILPTWLVHDFLENGRLERVLAGFEAPRTPVHAVFPTRGAPPHKVRAFVDFLAECFREHGVLAARAIG
jgi:DNA-binding transcriptional LysR family regulator